MDFNIMFSCPGSVVILSVEMFLKRFTQILMLTINVNITHFTPARKIGLII